MKSKKFLSLFISVIMCVMLFAVPVSADETTTTTLALSNCNITTKAVRLVFNETLTGFTAKLYDSQNNEIETTPSTSSTYATIKLSNNASMKLNNSYYVRYTATSASGTLDGLKKITFSKIWEDDFEGYANISGLETNYTTYNTGANGFEGFSLETSNGNTQLKLTKDQVFLNPNVTIGETATYEIDVFADGSTEAEPKKPAFILHTNVYDAHYDARKICVYNSLNYQNKMFTFDNISTVHGETFAFIREITRNTDTTFYAGAFRNGEFLGEASVTNNTTYSDTNYTRFAIAKWDYNSSPNVLIDNMKIYTTTDEDIDVSTALALENVSATRSEITLDYNAEVIGGTFTLKQNGSTVDATVTKTNNNKSVIIEPVSLLSLDTAYEINATGIPDYNGGTLAEYNKAFILEKMFEDDFDSYSTASDMDGVWIVSFKGATEYNTVSGFNADAKQNGNITDNVYDIVKDSNGNGKLVINRNYNNYVLNIKAADTSKWKNYTLEMTVEKDNGTNYNLDIFYHLLRENGGPNDNVRIFRLGLWNGDDAQHYFSGSGDCVGTNRVFNKNSHNLIFTTKTGKDLQVYSDRTEVLSRDFGTNSLGTGEIGFRKTSGDTNKQYIDNVLVYKYVELTEVPENFALENISATKSEITLDYNASVLGGNFVLTKGGEAVSTTVTKTNANKTVVIKPADGLSLDTAYEIKATDIPNYNGGALAEYNQAFMLKTLFADDFSYTSVSEMDSVWNVSYQGTKQYTVSGFNANTEKQIYTIENGKLAINGNTGANTTDVNATLNIRSYNSSEWQNYTLELDIGKPDDKEHDLDIMYHMYRYGDYLVSDYSNNFRIGVWESKMADGWFGTESEKTHTEQVFTENSHHLKFTTKTGKDLQVFKDGTSVLTGQYASPLQAGEIGFKVRGADNTEYIDNVLVYKLVKLDNTQNNIFVKEASVTSDGVSGEYDVADYGATIPNDADVFVAAYGASDNLLGVDMPNNENNTFTISCTNPAEIVYVKVFLWEKDTIKPVALSGKKYVGYKTGTAYSADSSVSE